MPFTTSEPPYLFRQIRRHFQRATRPMVIWCLLIAVPVFGVSNTLVELLGANHFHRAAATSPRSVDADPMRGWVDMRRVAGITTALRAHPHSHALFARHHHDPEDASVVALDGGLLQGDASDDGGASAASLSLVMASTGIVGLALPSASRFAWLAAAAAAAMPWTAGAPLRPPKA